MKKIIDILGLLLITVFLITNNVAAQSGKVDPYAPGENIYKHYTGTIGKRKVVLDLVYGFQGSSNYGGSRYYFIDSPGTFHFYIKEPPTFNHDELLQAVVVEDVNPFGETQEPFLETGIQWEFKISGRNISGKYSNSNTGVIEDIQLTEDYGNAFRFDLNALWDYTYITMKDGRKLIADISLYGITPGIVTNISEMDFFNKQLLKFGPEPKIQAEYIADYYRAYNKNFLKRSYFDMKQLVQMNQVDESKMSSAGYFRQIVYILPLYNDEGFLSVKSEVNHLNGEPVQTRYLNLDVKNYKPLLLKNILVLNHRILSGILETELRRKYNLANVQLNTILLKPFVPLTHNFYLSHKGITFVYPAGELLKERDITIYLTFNQVWGLLKKDFRLRLLENERR